MSILNVNQIQPVGGGNTITVGSSNIDYSGSITGNISVDGNLTVTGVVSNEDVTNIDSVGIITARSDVSIADKIVHTGDTNTAIRFPAADTFTVETAGSEALRVNSSGSFGVGTNNPQLKFVVSNNNALGFEVDPSQSSGTVCGVNAYDRNASAFKPLRLNAEEHRFDTSSTQRLRITSDGKIVTSGGAAVGTLTLAGDGKDITFGRTQNSGTGGVGRLVATGNIVYLQAGQNTSSGSAADLVFGNYGGVGERVRITSAGLVGVGVASPSLSYGNGIHIAGGNAGLKLQNTNNGDWAYVEYADESNTTKFIQGYRDSSGVYAIRPGTSLNATPGISLTSAGQVIVNGTANLAHPNMDDIVVGDASGNRGITVASATNGFGTLAFGDSTDGSGNDRYQGFIEYYHNDNSMRLGTVAQERFNISNIGHVITKGNSQGNPVGIEIRNNNTNAYSHAQLALTSQNATTSKIWCDVPNSGMRLNYNNGSSVKIDQSGNLHMPNGAGIDFSATANSSGSMGSELLDDYEEGSWTPVIDNLTNTPSYDNLSGRYTRIGRVVHLMGFIQINGTTLPTYSNESSAWSVSGLPYARSSTGACGYVAARGIVHGQNFQYNGSFNDYGTTGVVNIGFISTTALGLYVTGSGNGTIRGQVRRSSMKNTFIIEFDIVYNA